MKTIVSLTITLLFFCQLTIAQEKEDKTQKPGEKITVNREYDDQGNLIRFDSTYVFEWHGDTMMAFPNGGNFQFSTNGFPDMEEFMSQFFGDSAFSSPFGSGWQNDVFRRHEEMMKNFGFPFDQQGFMNGFTFGPDSMYYHFDSDSTGNISPFFDEFGFPDFSQFFQGFGGFDDNSAPSFNNQDEEKEWQDLMDRYQKEMEEFQKKWDSKNKSKSGADIKIRKI